MTIPTKGRSSGRARGGRGHHQELEEGNNERWLLTYSDMITLLLVLFIVLFAISQISQAKFREFKQSVGGMTEVKEIVNTVGEVRTAVKPSNLVGGVVGIQDAQEATSAVASETPTVSPPD